MLIIEFIDVAHGLSIEQIVLITHKDSAIPRGRSDRPKGSAPMNPVAINQSFTEPTEFKPVKLHEP